MTALPILQKNDELNWENFKLIVYFSHLIADPYIFWQHIFSFFIQPLSKCFKFSQSEEMRL